MGQISVEYNVGGIEGMHVITPKKFVDDRGFYMKAAGIDYSFVQDNQSMSVKGVLRGMHFQIDHPQAKLLRVISGVIYDAVIDIRKGSKTFGKWYAEVLSAENCRQVLIPEGLAHGFLVLSDTAEISYKCNVFYHPNDEGGIFWNDPDVGIEWPLAEIGEGVELIISEKDKRLPGMRDVISCNGNGLY